MSNNLYLNHLKTVVNYRNQLGDNPQHNEHIIEQANMVDAAFAENNQNITFVLKEMLNRLDRIEER